MSPQRTLAAFAPIFFELYFVREEINDVELAITEDIFPTPTTGPPCASPKASSAYGRCSLIRHQQILFANFFQNWLATLNREPGINPKIGR